MASSAPTSAVKGKSIAYNLTSTRLAWVAQGGLLVYGTWMLKLILGSPFQRFTLHPALQAFCVIVFTEGILLLQPTKTASEKAAGLWAHQVAQFAGLFSVMGGSYVIYQMKEDGGAPHFTSYHGLAGILTTLQLIAVTAFGSSVVYAPMVHLFGGSLKAKGFWKFHRMGGYLSLILIYTSTLLSIYTGWMKRSAGEGEKVGVAVALLIAGVGTMGRVEVSKLGMGGKVKAKGGK